MHLKVLALIILVLCTVISVSAADQYKPYLHKATVPQHPEIKLYGEYSTNLYSGIAVYSYIIDTPKGVNGLQPTIGIYYNSESMSQRPGVLGAGWSMNYNYIYRDINSTLTDTSDDYFILYLDGNTYELVNYDGEYRSRVDYFYRIQNFSNYWIITKQDGTQHRFGFNSDSNVVSNNGQSYSVKWAVDLVTDTHGNTIEYSYLQNPNSEDIGSQYLSQILYNSDELRSVEFLYESSVRPDRRRIYQTGNLLEESRRLTDIIVKVDGALVKRDHFEYVTLNPALTSISKISHFGSDNTTTLYNITFEYYNATPGYYNSTVFVPPVLFSNDARLDYGSRLIDVNNDGLVDIVQGNGSSKIWINSNNTWTLSTSWVLPVNITDSSGTDLGVRFDDVNNDGFVDILKYKNGSTQGVYLHNGTAWVLSNWSVPLAFVDSSGVDQGVNIVNLNGDGKIDIVYSKDGVRRVYLNNGSSWALNDSWIIPVDFLSGTSDTGARFIDINGDGMTDIVRSSNLGSVNKSVWLNNASGFVSSNWTIPLIFTTTATADTGVRFADLNSDGLVDLVESYVNGSVTSGSAWINNGTGWTQDDNWRIYEAFTNNGFNIGRRLSDVNGDGFTDVVVSHQASPQIYTVLKNSTFPYMLKIVRNEYGGLITLNYTTSTSFDNRVNGISLLGFNIYVIKSVIKDNNLSSFNFLSNYSYNYSLGMYNYSNKEFRGFGVASEFTSDSRVDHYFHQDSARKGKEFRTIVYSASGDLMSRKDTGYNFTLSDGLYNLSVLYVTDYMYDGRANASVTNKTFLYNAYGNYQYIIDHGDASTLGDERYYNYSYAINTDDWILNKVSRETLYDNNLLKVREKKYYYDNLGLTGVAKGDLTKVEMWNSDGNNSFNYFTYDSYGNVVTKTDNYANTDKYTYDVTNTYLASAINALGHITYYSYNASTGNLISSTMNDITTSYEYDIFGRVVKEIMPYDSASLPTKKYIYSFDGVSPEKIVVKQRTTANKTIDTAYFYDGFANLVQLKINTESGEVVKNLFYDSQFRLFKEQNPYYATYSADLNAISSTENYTTYTYDSLGRVIEVLNPDGTTKEITFDQRNITDYDENGHSHMYVLDAFGRIVKVYEHVTDPLYGNVSYITSYSYDNNDNLIKIVDNEGHSFNFSYDSLSRKTSMNDPDMGYWVYVYDLNGNLVRQIDNRGANISLRYDALNRVIAKNSSNANVSFIYDTQYHGTLSRLLYVSGNNNISYNYTYDERMRPIAVSKTINGLLFENSYMYDSAGRVILQRISTDIIYNYNNLGKVSSINGYVNASSYNALGQILNRTFANNLVQSYAYRSDNYRLSSISIPSVQNMIYTYDSVGNIVSINDSVNGRLHYMTYDSLDRMTQVLINNDRYAYSYNSLGNIMKQVYNNESKKYVYNGLAHAPSSIINGSSGVDLYEPHDIGYASKLRVFEFFILNDNNYTLNSINVSVDYGNGKIYNITNLNITNNLMLILQTNYSNGGDYVVKINTTSNGIKDYQWKTLKFGMRANNLTLIYSNTSYRGFVFTMENDIIETVYNVSWNCTNGINSINFTVVGNMSVFDVMMLNYTTPGAKNLTCFVRSTDGNETKMISFSVDGLKLSEYDVLYTSISRRVITYDLKNHFTDVTANLTMIGNSNVTRLINLSSNKNIMVVAEFNYSSDSYKDLTITATSNTSSDLYKDRFTTRGVDIRNYDRLQNNYTSVLLFEIVNNWHAGYVNWSVSEPNKTNSSFLENNKSIIVIIEHNYTAGNKQPVINATISSYVDRFSDYFIVKPLRINNLLTLSEGSRTVTELDVENTLANNQILSWRLNTGISNLTSNKSITLNGSQNILVLIESNYTTSTIYRTVARVNNSLYNDNRTGVVLT